MSTLASKTALTFRSNPFRCTLPSLQDVKTAIKEKVMGAVEEVKRRFLYGGGNHGGKGAITRRGLALRLFYDFREDRRVSLWGGDADEGGGGGRGSESERRGSERRGSDGKGKKKKRRSIDVFMRGLSLMSPKGGGGEAVGL